MSKSLKLSMAMIVVVLVALFAAVTFSRAGEEPAPTGSGNGASAPLVRDDSPRLTSGKKAVFVEYLDFECEACGAAHPVMTDLRKKYGNDVTFIVRYLSLHGNSMNAALAAEAAREQDKFEEMHDKLFETQTEWSHSPSSKEKAFEGYAKELGLDMKQYRADLKDPAATQRIEQSKKDAQTLGVTGTPTFFVDGKKIEPTTIADFETKLDAAIED